ncbi:MAG: hypothetical protein JWO09_3379 [Bacteroidetes bacterium]|nr:hypothetical protein [Bacteroidota bacterium]
MNKHLLFYLFLIGMNVNAQPNLAWAKQTGGHSGDIAKDLVTDKWGNVYTTGIFSDTVDFDPGPGIYNLTAAGNTDIFILKQDASGAFLWAKSLGGNMQDEARSITIDSSGNLYLAGSFEGSADFDPGPPAAVLISSGHTDIFISKFDNNGSLLWVRKAGGRSDDGACSVQAGPRGSVVVAGMFRDTVDFDPGPGIADLLSPGYEDAFIMNLNSSGDLTWVKQLHGPADDIGFSIALDAPGNCYITGYFNGSVDFNPDPGVFNMSSMDEEDIFILKLDTAGSFVWARSMGGSLSNMGLSIATDPYGNVYTTGMFWGTVDFDPGAGTCSITSPGSFDVFISKLDAAGNFVWAKAMQGPSVGEGYSIAVDAYSNVFVTGVFWGTVDFDPGVGVYELNPVGNCDIYILKLDASGNFSWAASMGSTGVDAGYAISVDGYGNIYLCGMFSNAMDADPGSGLFTLTPTGGYDIFIQKLYQGTAAIGEANAAAAVSVFPNPSPGIFYISLPQYEESTIHVYDATGNCVWSAGPQCWGNLQIDLSVQKQGIYFIEVLTRKGKSVRKLVLQ